MSSDKPAALAGRGFGKPEADPGPAGAEFGPDFAPRWPTFERIGLSGVPLSPSLLRSRHENHAHPAASKLLENAVVRDGLADDGVRACPGWLAC